MNDQAALERRYRRWLAFYPRSFREGHGEELVAVLLQAAAPRQSHPTASEAADLAMHGLRQRTAGRFPSRWEREHAKAMFPVRVAIALWLCFISAVLIGFQHGEVWLALTIPCIAAHVYIAYKIRPGVTRT